MIHDHRSGRAAAVLPVRGSAFALLDADEQVRRLEGWRAVLGTVARAGTPVGRLQWVQRSTECRAERATTGPLVSVDRAGCSYRDLLSSEAATGRSHAAWMVVAVAAPRGLQRVAHLDALRSEVRFLQGQLRNADLLAGAPLDRDTLCELLAASHADHGHTRSPWAMASDESWGALRLDGGWHATYWIAEWPRLEVGPDFLTPLLIAPDRRTVSVVMAPVAPERAARQVRAARAADAADEELRSRAGFLPSARRSREADGVLQREHELADGHAEYRFSGYVTVTADDRAGLAASCAQVEQSAQESHLELRRLYGRQAEAYTWTLPLARGLA